MTCGAKPKPQVELIRCVECKAELQQTCFDSGKLMRWKKSCNISRSAVCLACEAKPKPQVEKPKPQVEVITCTRCRKVKQRKEYDDLLLERWTKHRELKKKAECKTCAAARGVKTHEPKRVWQQTKYTCSQCQNSQQPSHYDYKHLEILEEQEQVYLAVCISCKKRR